MQFSHHVFLNLHTLKFYCLPDNYEIIDSSLEDITVCLGEGLRHGRDWEEQGAQNEETLETTVSSGQSPRPRQVFGHKAQP